MAKVTKDLQIAIPSELAERHGIKPGDDVEWREGPNGLQLSRAGARTALPVAARLDLFDQATIRVANRNRQQPMMIADRPSGRGWTREQLYHDRGRTR
jgi:bifunctional DNA-binding transcriptional regulator/antitoxin component of YhaV-PrlF toxin-antitoxin module